MNNGFPPLFLRAPESRQRKPGKGQGISLPPEILAKRLDIARDLKIKVEGLSRHLKSLTDDERRAIFYKLEHEKFLNRQTLSGTDLKAIFQPSPQVIYAVPQKGKALDGFLKKIEDFGTGRVTNKSVPNAWLGQLKSVVEANPKDRLSSDLRRRYSHLIKCQKLICELEFSSLQIGTKKQKEELEAWLKDLEQVFGCGIHGVVFEHEIMLPTCRVVIRCTGPMFMTLVEEQQWIERIRWIESRPRFQTFTEVVRNFHVDALAPLEPPPKDASVICIVDSGVTTGNPFLQKVVAPELSKSFLRKDPDNTSDEHGHGSAVASLASYYSLNLARGAENTPRLWIANARILNSENQIEDERLFSKVLEEVVQHFNKYGVRIFCLAVGDTGRLWSDSTKLSLPRTSWVARRIDHLSRQYDVVFVTCTGNIDRFDLREWYKHGKLYPEYLNDETARVLDPGHAALAVTVGSVAPGTTVVEARESRAIALRNEPSPFTRSGPGIRNEIKPEVVDYGGNLAFDSSLKTVVENRGLSIVTASRQLTPAVSFFAGTSCAAPRVAHRLGLIDHDLRSLGITASACLLRAFLVNSATIRNEASQWEFMNQSGGPKRKRDALVNVVGYGVPDQNRATGCDDYSAITFFQGVIRPDQVLFFDIPVPANLSESQDQRRLTVTVVYAPEVQRWGLQSYFADDLEWRMFRGDTSRSEIVLAMSEADDEIIEGAVYETPSEQTERKISEMELPFLPSYRKRSRGTVQHATLEWRQHRRFYSNGHYTLAIAARHKWGLKNKDIPLAVVVRLEELGRSVPIYSEVRAAIEVEV